MHKPSKGRISGISIKDCIFKDGDGRISYIDYFDIPVFKLHLINLRTYEDEISNAQTK